MIYSPPALQAAAAAFILAAFCTALATPCVRYIAERWGALDIPGGRKTHAVAVPRLGGIAVILGIAVGILLAVASAPDSVGGSGPLIWTAAGGVAVLLAIGVADDFRALGPVPKLAVEVAAAALVLTLTPLLAIDLGFAVVMERFEGASLLIGILWVVTVTNAYNMIDGLDGLASGIGAIAAVALALGALLMGAPLIVTLLLLATSGALTGFLLYNGSPARIFLGDSGSLPVGFLLGVLSIYAYDDRGVWRLVPAALALAVPLLDLCIALLRRSFDSLRVVRQDHLRERFVLEMRPPTLFMADGRHLHHRLLSLNLSRRHVVLLMYLMGFGFAILSLNSGRWHVLASLALPFAAVVVLFIGLRMLYEEMRFFERGVFLPVFSTRIARSRWVHAAFDMAVFFGSFITAHELLSPGSLLFEGLQPGLVVPAAAAAGAGVLVLFSLGIYRFSFRHAGVWIIVRMIGALVAATAVMTVVGFFLIEHPLPWALWILAGYFATSAILLSRMSFKILEAIYQRGRHEGRRAVIFGAGRGGTAVLRELLENPAIGLWPVAFIDDEQLIWHKMVEGIRVHPGGHHLADTLRELSADVLIVSSEKISASRLTDVNKVCRRTKVGMVRSRVLIEEESVQVHSPEADQDFETAPVPELSST